MGYGLPDAIALAFDAATICYNCITRQGLPVVANREFKLPVWTGVVFWTVVLYSDVFSESVKVQYYKCQPLFFV
jgi:hypothetical protein